MLTFGGRAVWRLGHRNMGPPPAPRQTDVLAIAGWMTVPYIGRVYAVPPAELFGALGIDGSSHRTATLDAIAQETGRNSEAVIETVRAAVTTWQATHRPLPPDGAGPER